MNIAIWVILASIYCATGFYSLFPTFRSCYLREVGSRWPNTAQEYLPPLFACCRHVPCLFSSFSVARGVCKYVFVGTCLCIYSTAIMLSSDTFNSYVTTLTNHHRSRPLRSVVPTTYTTGTTPIYTHKLRIPHGTALRLSPLQRSSHPRCLSRTGSATSSVSHGSLPKARGGEPGRSAGAGTTNASAKPGLRGRSSTLESRSQRISGHNPWGSY